MTSVIPSSDTVDDTTPCLCDGCGKTWMYGVLEPISDAEERLHPGQEVPAGDCPDNDCGSLCFVVKPTDMIKAAPLTFTREELATVLAALRFWQANSGGEMSAEGLVGSEHTTLRDIATGEGTLTPLDADEIDDLCERINV